jgi:hypothetical protein
MAVVNSRESLKQYALRALGAPVLEINVDDDQLEDRLDEGLEYWRQYHYDGIERMYMKYQITQTDIDNKYIPIPDLVYGITRVIPVTNTSSSKNLFDLQYQLRLHDLYDLTSVSVVYFKNVMSHIALLDFELNGPQTFRFNRLQNRLYIDIDWTWEVKDGTYIVVECYRALDPDSFTKVWNEQWFKKYTIALFKKQWATNIKKFSNIQLPGGVTLDGDKLYDEATTEIDKLEDDLQNKSAPLEFFLG